MTASRPLVIGHLAVIVHPLFNVPNYSGGFSLEKIKKQNPRLKGETRDQWITRAEQQQVEAVKQHYLQQVRQSAAQGAAVAFLTFPDIHYRWHRSASLQPKRMAELDRKSHEEIMKAVETLGTRGIVLSAEETQLPLEIRPFAATNFENAAHIIEEKLRQKGLLLHPRAKVEIFGEEKKYCVEFVRRSFKSRYRAKIAKEKCP